MLSNSRKDKIMKQLAPHSKVAFIAPSAQICDNTQINLGIKYIESLGFEIIFGKNIYKQSRYMAGSDEERASDVNEAFANPEIKAIFCVRAAAGASRILPYLDYDLIKKNPKPLIGFCDNVALGMALNKKSNIIFWNGFLPTYDFKDGDFDSLVQSSFEQLLKGQKYTITSGITKKFGQATGKLLCANLSTLTYLCGTPYFPNLKNKILLIEDIHERYHKIDLMLQQLKQQPNFKYLKGIIFGNYTYCSGDFEDGSLEDCFDDFLENTHIPAIQNFDFGHTKSRYVLPLGATVKMDADKSTLDILHY